MKRTACNSEQHRARGLLWIIETLVFVSYGELKLCVMHYCAVWRGSFASIAEQEQEQLKEIQTRITRSTYSRVNHRVIASASLVLSSLYKATVIWYIYTRQSMQKPLCV